MGETGPGVPHARAAGTDPSTEGTGLLLPPQPFLGRDRVKRALSVSRPRREGNTERTMSPAPDRRRDAVRGSLTSAAIPRERVGWGSPALFEFERKTPSLPAIDYAYRLCPFKQNQASDRTEVELWQNKIAFLANVGFMNWILTRCLESCTGDVGRIDKPHTVTFRIRSTLSL